MTLSLRAALLAVGFVTFAAVAAVGQGQATKALDDTFKKGIEALDDEEWSAAVKYFQEAIKLEPTESSRRIGKSVFGWGGDEYLPHVRLGQAFVGLGDCAAAFREWEESERQGVVKKSGDGQEIIEEGSEECQDKGFLPSAEFAKREQGVSAVLREAAEIDKDLATLRAASPDANAPEPKALYDRGRTELANARTKLETARRTRLAQAMTEAVSAAESARTALTTARRGAERAIALEGGPKVPAPTGDVEALIERASRTAQAVGALLATSPVTLTLPTDTMQAQQQAQASLQGARDKVASARKSGAEGELAEARKLATGAQTGFTQLLGDVEQLRDTAIRTELQRLRASTDGLLATADARVSSMQSLLKSSAPAASDAKKAQAQLTAARASLARARQQFEQARKASDVDAARMAARAVSDVTDDLNAIAIVVGGAPVPVTIPDALKAAAQAFFGGRYEDVAKLLAPDVLDSMPASLRVHAHTLRAASFFARYEYSNRRDESMRQAARADADASRRLDPAIQPNPAAFAPKFIAFYSETTAAVR